MNEVKLGENEISETAGETAGRSISAKHIGIAAAVAAVVIGGAAYLFWPRAGGQAVPTPKSVTFGGDETGPAMPAGDQTLTIPAEQVERAGIRVEPVGETMSAAAESIASTAVIQANGYRETPVISLLGGVVRRVNVELGQTVAKGQTVAVVFSDELAAAQSRYITLGTEVATSKQAYERAAKLAELNPISRGELDMAAAKLKIAEAELAEHIRHHERARKLLAIGAESRAEFEMAVTKMKTAEAEVTQARENHKRAIEVARLNPVGRGEFEMAAVKMRSAETERAAARDKLILLGLSPGRVEALRSPSQISSEIALTAPVAGTVTARNINPGMVVEPNKDLLKVTDLSTVWAVAQVYENDIGKLRQGSGASVTSDAYPGRIFRGNVAYIDPNIEPQTRTAQVRIELDNSDRSLKIGMYVNASFAAATDSGATAPTIPASAVQMIGNRQMVFAATGEPNVFALKFVRLGTESDGRFTVIEGLKAGDRIVTDGSFLLRAEWLKLHPGDILPTRSSLTAPRWETGHLTVFQEH